MLGPSSWRIGRTRAVTAARGWAVDTARTRGRALCGCTWGWAVISQPLRCVRASTTWCLNREMDLLFLSKVEAVMPFFPLRRLKLAMRLARFGGVLPRLCGRRTSYPVLDSSGYGV